MYFLAIPYILLLIPVLPCFKSKRIRSLSIIASFLASWFYLSSNRIFEENQITILNKNNTDVIIYKRGEEVIVFGNLSNIEHAKTLVSYIDTNGIKNIKLCIPVANYYNIKNFSYLIKNTLVSECYLSSRYLFKTYMKRFCEIIDADEIGLKIREFRYFRYSKRTNLKYTLNNPSDLFRNPLKNIDQIHHFIIKKYSQTNKKDIKKTFNNYSIIYI